MATAKGESWKTGRAARQTARCMVGLSVRKSLTEKTVAFHVPIVARRLKVIMNLNLAVQLVEFQVERFPALTGWTVTTTHAKSRLALCRYRTRQIIMSEGFLRNNSPKEIQELALHEIAHALVGPKQGHGPVWQQQARILGIQPKRCYDYRNTLGKFVAVCPKCAKVYSLHRKFDPNRKRWCRACGPEGNLTFHENNEC